MQSSSLFGVKIKHFWRHPVIAGDNNTSLCRENLKVVSPSYLGYDKQIRQKTALSAITTSGVD